MHTQSTNLTATAPFVGDGWFVPPCSDDHADTLDTLLEFYGLGLWTVRRYSDGAYQVTVHVDDRFPTAHPIGGGAAWTLTTAEYPRLVDAIWAAVVAFTDAAPSFEVAPIREAVQA